MKMSRAERLSSHVECRGKADKKDPLFASDSHLFAAIFALISLSSAIFSFSKPFASLICSAVPMIWHERRTPRPLLLSSVRSMAILAPDK